MKQYFVYIMTSNSGTLYTGVTNDLERGVYQHKHKLIEGFTSRYNVNRLVYFETFGDVRDAIAREKQIKGWRRSKKLALIESMNPKWQDLSEDWEECCYANSPVIPSETRNPNGIGLPGR